MASKNPLERPPAFGYYRYIWPPRTGEIGVKIERMI
jgi:hypothetical protein